MTCGVTKRSDREIVLYRVYFMLRFVEKVKTVKKARYLWLFGRPIERQQLCTNKRKVFYKAKVTAAWSVVPSKGAAVNLINISL